MADAPGHVELPPAARLLTKLMTARDLAKGLLPPILLDGLRSLRAARRKAGAGVAVWRRVSAGVLAGHELRLPEGEGWADGMIAGTYERAFATALAEAVRPGDVCYDLGGHVGYYSLVMARRAGPRGAVHVFEPYAPNAARIREHAARNADPAERAPIHLHACAVGGETGTHALVAAGDADVTSTLAHLDGTTGVMSPLWRERFTRFPRHEVPVRRLDDWRAEADAPPPDVIKLDVEGSELDVLRGARQTLAAARPTIIAELHNAGLAAECGAFLGAMGYEVHVFSCETGKDCLVRAVHPQRAAAS